MMADDTTAQTTAPATAQTTAPDGTSAEPYRGGFETLAQRLERERLRQLDAAGQHGDEQPPDDAAAEAPARPRVRRANPWTRD